MTRRSMTLALCTAMAASTLAGQGALQSPKVYGAGSMTCAAWLADASRFYANSEKLSWVLGYVSAMGGTVQFQRSITPEWMVGVIDAQCEARPTDTLLAGAQSVVRLAQTPDMVNR